MQRLRTLPGTFIAKRNESGICASSTLKIWLLQVLPDKTVAVLLYLAPHHKASRSARSVPSTFKLDFTVAESMAAAGPVEQISDSQSAPAFTLPSPPPMPTQVHSACYRCEKFKLCLKSHLEFQMLSCTSRHAGWMQEAVVCGSTAPNRDSLFCIASAVLEHRVFFACSGGGGWPARA